MNKTITQTQIQESLGKGLTLVVVPARNQLDEVIPPRYSTHEANIILLAKSKFPMSDSQIISNEEGNYLMNISSSRSLTSESLERFTSDLESKGYSLVMGGSR